MNCFLKSSHSVENVPPDDAPVKTPVTPWHVRDVERAVDSIAAKNSANVSATSQISVKSSKLRPLPFYGVEVIVSESAGINDFTFPQAAPPETDKQQVDNQEFHGSLNFVFLKVRFWLGCCR